MIYLIVEFLDELVFGASDASLPLMRSDLNLTYIQIGLLLSLPGFVSNFIEPFLFILSSVWRRRLMLLIGGIAFAISLYVTAFTQSYWVLIFSFIIFNPASGMFIDLSQAALMDADPAKHESNMAKWTFAGSLGVTLGPLLLGSIITAGYGWRETFLILALLATLILIAAWRLIPAEGEIESDFPSISAYFGAIQNALAALRNKNIWRWLILLEFSDLMLDVLYAFLALYFVDVASFTPGEAAFAVAIWTGVGLLGDFLLIPLVERVKGLDYLRLSVVIELILFPAFLLIETPWLKLIILGALGFFNSGWYAILKANFFSELPGQSAIVLALDNVSGLIGKLLPFSIGLAAQAFGLQWAMWLLLAGPIALLIGLPKHYTHHLKPDP